MAAAAPAVDKEILVKEVVVVEQPIRVEPPAKVRKVGKLGFAVVGLGRAGHFHMTSLGHVSKLARLSWVIDSDQAKVDEISKQMGCKGSTNIEDALKDPTVAAVIIASVTYSHYGYCKQSLLAGKAVFTEKPISHKPEELAEIIDMAVEKGLPFIVGYQRRVDKNFRELKRQIRAGSVGGIRLIKCTSRDNPLPPLEYLRVSGGIFYDMLTHDFDMIHFLSEEFPVEVHAVGHCHLPEIKEMDDIDMVVCTLTFASGLIATVDCSRIAAYGYDQRVEVFGDKGMATAHNPHTSTVVLATDAGFSHPPAEWSFPQRYEHTYTVELGEFVSMVQAGAVEPEEIVRRHVRLELVTAAAELSWRLGRPVKLAEVDSLRHHMNHGSH